MNIWKEKYRSWKSSCRCVENI